MTDSATSIGPDVTFLKKVLQRHSWEAHVTQDINRGKIRPALLKSLSCPFVAPPLCRFPLLEECLPLDSWPRLLLSIHSFSSLYHFCQDGKKEREGEEKCCDSEQKGGVKAKNLSVVKVSLGSVASTVKQQ